MRRGHWPRARGGLGLPFQCEQRLFETFLPLAQLEVTGGERGMLLAELVQSPPEKSNGKAENRGDQRPRHGAKHRTDQR